MPPIAAKMMRRTNVENGGEQHFALGKTVSISPIAED
jgi:hypothetical protein